MCLDHIDGTVMHVLREIIPECVLKLVRGLYLNQFTRHSTPRTEVVVKVDDIFFSALLLCVCIFYAYHEHACLDEHVLLFIYI